MKMKLCTSIIILVVACITTPVFSQRWLRQQQQQQQQAQYCVTPENYYGSCVPLNYCPQIANVFKISNARQAQQYVILSQRACGTRNFNGEPVVCCTQPLSFVQTTQRPFEPTTFSNPFLPTAQPQTETPATRAPTRAPITRAPTSAPTTATQISTTNADLIDNRGSYCRDPKRVEGTCIPIKDCQALLDELQVKQTDERFKTYLRASNGICGSVDTNVCCPRLPETKGQTTSSPSTRNFNDPRRLPTVEEGCGFSNNTYKKIVGGQVSKKGVWPWIALIGYDDELSASPFKCGGTLVTARHVITAAHCLVNGLSFVRLGEHDLSTTTEAPHVDVRVLRSERHPDYNRRNGHSDIAILYLERNVDFTASISPICMPTTEELRKRSYVKNMPFVAGWGKTMEGGKSSTVLQELQIPVYDNEVCVEKYREQGRLFTENQFDEAVICAGVLSGGKDTCQGDSGGPLMIPEPYGKSVRFYLIGVVSYGIGCARPQIPGVYSSTQYFMDWIIEKIADAP